MSVSNILVKNIYYMLSYAFSILRRSGFEKVGGEDFDNIHDLFAALLAAGIGRQLKHGLHREYIARKDDLSIVRGKIDLAGTIRNRRGRIRKIACEFDELAENNIFNQILKTTVLLLLKCRDVKPEHRDDLKRKMLFFSGVDILDPSAIRWSRIRFQRNNQTYLILIGLCRFVLQGMLLSEHGEQKLAAFADEQRMCRLYEKFILEYYRRHHPELAPEASQIPWALDDDRVDMLPEMQSDITLSRGKRTLIIDAKFYGKNMQSQFDKRTIHSGNLYQIFTYVKNKNRQSGFTDHEVSGLLLYARTEEELQPDADYSMSGNNISVKTLDLNRPFAEISRQLEGIAAGFGC